MTIEERLQVLVSAAPRDGFVSVPVGWIEEILAGRSKQPAARDQTSSTNSGLPYTVQELAALAGRSVSTVRAWMPLIPDAHKFRGREWRVPREAAHQFLAGGVSGVVEQQPIRLREKSAPDWRRHFKKVS
jgi:hypothetical protein